METCLLQLNSDPLLTQLIQDDYAEKQWKSAASGNASKSTKATSGSDSRETQVYVVPSSKSDAPALIVWSRPLTSRKRLSSSTCTLGPEELLGVSAAKRALNGASPWSDGRERFDLSSDAPATAAAVAVTDSAAGVAAGADTNAVASDGTVAAAASAASVKLSSSSSSSPTQQQSPCEQQLQQQQQHLGLIGPVELPRRSGLGGGGFQSVYSRYSEKLAYKRLLKVLRRHPYLDRDAVKYNKLLLLENSLDVCHRFQASQPQRGSVGGHRPHQHQHYHQQQRPECASLEDLAVEESHLVSAIREHVTELPYLAAFAPKGDRRVAKIEARARRIERRSDACAECHATMCAACLVSAASAATVIGSEASDDKC